MIPSAQFVIVYADFSHPERLVLKNVGEFIRNSFLPLNEKGKNVANLVLLVI